MKVVFYDENKFQQLNNDWDKLALNPRMTPFQYFNWQSLLLNEHKVDLIKMYLCKPLYAVLMDDNGTVLAIAPIFLKKIGRQKGVFFIGSGGGSDYLDFIYNELFSSEMFTLLMNEIIKYTKAKQIHFSLLHSDSLVRKYLSESIWSKSSRYNTCVKVELPRSYPEHLARLSKSTRQNIRTANNRMKRDNLSSSLKVYDGEVIPSKLALELQSIYEQRRESKNIHEARFSSRLSLYMRKISLKRFAIFEEAMKTCKNSFTAILYINGDIASFCYGLKRNKGNICIMQVAIEKNYESFSPGMLLFDEIIKWLYEKYSNKLPILDLTNGDETYKFALGGVAHDTEFVILEVTR